MRTSSSDGEHGATRSRGFPTTRAHEVTEAGKPESEEGALALEGLCTTYWPPVYAFIRHKEYPADQARDLTQAFFEFLLEHNTFSRWDPARGRFRNFLVGSLVNFLATQRRHNRALSRGGGRPLVSLDEDEAERSYSRVARQTDTPETVYDRRWALNLLEVVFEQLRDGYRQGNKLKLFEALKDHIWATKEATPYEDLSEELGISAGALRLSALRLRRRYRELLRAEIAHFVASPEEVEEEIRYLIEVVSE